MAFADEITKRAGVKLAPAITATVGGATLRFSLQGKPLAVDKHFQDRIISLGAVTRELSDPQRGISTQGFDLSLANADAALSAYDPEDWLNAAITYDLYANGQSRTFFTGLVDNFRFTHDSLELNVADLGAEYLGETAKWYVPLSPADYPGLDPAYINLPMPLILGFHDSVAAGYAGMVPCIRLSPLRYLVAGHACAGVYRVFVGGVLQMSGYTVNLELVHPDGINGYVTAIDFDTAPESAVTADVKGMTDDLTASGILVQNLAAQAELLRREVFGLSDSNADTARSAAAIKYCQKHRIRGAARFADALAPREILGQLLGSGGLRGGWTAGGKWALWALDAPLDASLATAVDALRDLSPGGFSFAPASEEIANHLTVQYLSRAAAGGYLGQFVLQDTGSQSDLGRTYKRVYSLPCAADALTGWQVGQLHLARSAYQFEAELASPLHLATLELGELISLTDPWGPDSGGSGWSGRALWPTRFTHDSANGGLSASFLDVSRLVE